MNDNVVFRISAISFSNRMLITQGQGLVDQRIPGDKCVYGSVPAAYNFDVCCHNNIENKFRKSSLSFSNHITNGIVLLD